MDSVILYLCNIYRQYKKIPISRKAWGGGKGRSYNTGDWAIDQQSRDARSSSKDGRQYGCVQQLSHSGGGRIYMALYTAPPLFFFLYAIIQVFFSSPLSLSKIGLSLYAPLLILVCVYIAMRRRNTQRCHGQPDSTIYMCAVQQELTLSKKKCV